MNRLDADDRRIEQALRLSPDRLAAAAPGGVARRRFLQGLLAAGAVTAADASWFRSAVGAAPAAPGDRILVVVELTGGNDGLSMLAPTGNGRYHDLRQATAVMPGTGHRVADGWELHPALRWVAGRYAAGDVALVEGVGDQLGDHSHFSTMARVMCGLPSLPAAARTGWLGRYLDDAAGTMFGGVNVDNGGVPLHLVGRRGHVTGLTVDKRMFGATTSDGPNTLVANSVAASTGGTGLAGQIRDVFADSVTVARRIEPVYTPSTTKDGGAGEMARKLTLLANTINLDVGARVLTTRQRGYDTHSAQAPKQAQLLADLDAGLAAFYATLDPRFADRVSVLVFSEFGRRAKLNSSSGTDHGLGSVWLLLGNQVRGGRHGVPADLAALTSRGDVSAPVDVRSVYASVLSGWLGGDDAAILGRRWDHLDLFTEAPAARTGSTSAPQVDAPTSRYLDAVYGLFVGRSATAAEKSKWAPSVAAGRRSDVTNALAGTGEWAGVRVDDLYRTVLGRSADPGGRAHWLGRIGSGMTLAAVAAHFYGSDEYYARAGGTDGGFVTRLYRDILGRAPDAAGHAHWVRVLRTRSRSEVAGGFYGSIESRRQRVTTLYREILGRDPEVAGREHWASVVAADGDVRVAAHLAASAEYYQRTQR